MVKDSSTRETSSKRKRKTTATDQEADVDIYKKAVDFEQKEALNRSPDEDATIHLELCEKIRGIMSEMAVLKAEGNKTKVSEKCMEACVQIAILKKLNRMDKVRQVAAKEKLAAEKQKVDSINLQYQNLVYEAKHLLSEFTKCFQFKSKDEKIELIPVEEFMKHAPNSVTEKFQNADLEETTIKHELRLARLEWELEQRKNLAELHKTLEGDKKNIGKDIIEHKKKLEGLLPKLNVLLEATKPVQEHLNLPIDKVNSEKKLAALLPNPLYLFYVNANGYKGAYDLSSVTIQILGDTEEVTQWQKLQAATSLQEEEDSEVEPEPDSEEVVKKRRHRKSAPPKIDLKEEKKKKLLDVHPLSVEFTRTLKDGLTLRIKFSYLNNLGIVVVESSTNLPSKITGNIAKDVLVGENLLSELIDNDFGLESPNPDNVVQLKNIGFDSYQNLVPTLGFAYNWAQNICGLDFHLQETIKPYKICQNNVEKVMKLIKKRLEARFALATQLQQLEQNILPSLPEHIKMPKNVISSLAKFASRTYQQFCDQKYNDFLMDEDLISEKDMFYWAQITRGNATLEMFIVVKNKYPVQAPIISLMLKLKSKKLHSGNCDDVRDIERNLNTTFNEYGTSSGPWLLAAQVARACALLDVYLESTFPEVFAKNAMFLRNTCSRSRRKPFNFRQIGSGIFTQY